MRSRALRILHTLAQGIETAGYRVTTASGPIFQYGRSNRDRPLMQMVIGDYTLGIELTQQYDRVPHERTATERRQAERGYTYGIPTHDRIPNDRLTLTLVGRFEYRQSTWKDSKRTNLDDVLHGVLREIEIRAHTAERARLARERAEAERRRQWERAMKIAKLKLRGPNRAEMLTRQARAWRDAALIRDYVQAMARNASLEDIEAAVDRLGRRPRADRPAQPSAHDARGS